MIKVTIYRHMWKLYADDYLSVYQKSIEYIFITFYVDIHQMYLNFYVLFFSYGTFSRLLLYKTYRNKS